MQKSPELDALWAEYKRTLAIALRNRLIEAYLPLVDYLAERISERLPRCVTVDEVRSDGVLGLFDAVEKFDLGRHIRFETFASIRIRGSIQDELRSRDWVPRHVRGRTQKFSAAVTRLAARLGHQPSATEAIEQLQLTNEEYDVLQRDVSRLIIYSLSGSDAAEHDDSPADPLRRSLADQRELEPAVSALLRNLVEFSIWGLPPKEQQIIRLYYFGGLTMKEVGTLMRLTESRVCQIHGEAIARLQHDRALGQYACAF